MKLKNLRNFPSLKRKLYFLRILEVSVQFLGWGNWAANPCQQLVCCFLERYLMDPMCTSREIQYVMSKHNPLSVDSNGSEMSINKEIFKVALAVFPE